MYIHRVAFEKVKPGTPNSRIEMYWEGRSTPTLPEKAFPATTLQLRLLRDRRNILCAHNLSAFVSKFVSFHGEPLT
jgi:hypothetical protein